MKIIIGLGNPGKEYETTRHNAGFLALEALKKFLISNSQFLNKSKLPNFKFQRKFQAEILKLDARRYFLKTDLLLIKPQTFMNASGTGVKKILHYYDKTSTTTKTLKHYDNLYLIHDDLDLELGDYKIQFNKGPKRHNGVLSVEKELGTKDFWRVRIGIAKPEAEKKECLLSGKDYVLGRFSHKEKEILDKVVGEMMGKLMKLLTDG